MNASKPSFREELERLEAIVRELEETDIDLDRALELFEEGVGHLKTARNLLQQSELTVKRVLEEADGTLRANDLTV
jgi:exodeoxyribonuclease VII small subunit